MGDISHMRNLHINPRKYQEPFTWCQVEHNNEYEGFDEFVIIKEIVLFGSLMNKTQLVESGQLEALTNTLSIKILNQRLDIKPKDRVIYNKKQYIIINTDQDFYSQNEVVIICKFEKEINDKDKPNEDNLEWEQNETNGEPSNT